MLKKAFTLAELSLIFFIMAILAILFYRTLKPDNVVYNNLYYAAYTHLSDAFYEVISEDSFDINNFAEEFFKKVNVSGSSSSLNTQANLINFDVAGAKYDIPNVFENNFSTLTNGMWISFDKINYNTIGEPKYALIATVDINGNNPPNEYNKDRIQFEINKNGVLPIGDIETRADLLEFNIISKFDKELTGIKQSLTGEPHIVGHNKSYDVAACSTGLPRHSYYETNKSCGSHTIIFECNKKDLKCEIEAVKP